MNKIERDRKLLHDSKTCIINRGNSKQDALSAGYKRTVNILKTVTVTNTREISGTAKISQIPILDVTAIKFSRSETTTDTKSTADEIQAPPQKVSVEPRSKVAVSYQLYTSQTEYNYLLDFHLSGKSTAVFKSCFIFTILCDTYEFEFIPWLQRIPSDMYMPTSSSNGNELSFEYYYGKYILKIFPMKIAVENTTLGISYGPHIALSDSELSTNSDADIQC